jgi:oxaloacetate decarboxylase alpha subunit
VRKELGYPGMATPFSQLVGTLAVLNIVTGKRYSVIPGRSASSTRPAITARPPRQSIRTIMDRIMSAPRAKYRNLGQSAGAADHRRTAQAHTAPTTTMN